MGKTAAGAILWDLSLEERGAAKCPDIESLKQWCGVERKKWSEKKKYSEVETGWRLRKEG